MGTATATVEPGLNPTKSFHRASKSSGAIGLRRWIADGGVRICEGEIGSKSPLNPRDGLNGHPGLTQAKKGGGHNVRPHTSDEGIAGKIGKIGLANLGFVLAFVL